MKKTKKEQSERREIDMSYHDYKMKSLGLSKRLQKMAIRFILFLIPVVVIILLLTKSK